MPPTDQLAEFLERTRVRIDLTLDRVLPAPPTCPDLVSAAMRYSVFAGGKRLRPTLTLAAADAVARSAQRSNAGAQLGPYSPEELALPAACAVELIHTYSLIHDDLPSMDNDTLRRGRPTLHVVYGEGVAVLAGDGLQAEAFGLLAREPAHEVLEPDAAATLSFRKLAVLEIVAAAAGAVGMVGGQAIDLQAAGQVAGRPLTLDADALRGMHARKTGAMIRASALAGAVMAGADDRQRDAIERYATEIGLAFQIVDDILDVEGNADALGKTAGKDAAGSKPTYVALFGLERSRQLARECLERAHGALHESALTGGHLGAIADWVVTRKN